SLFRPPPLSSLFPYTTLFRSARMLRQFVTENLLLLCLGSALGLILASGLVQVGARLDLGALPRAQYIGINGSVLAFTVVIALIRSEEHTSELQSRGHLVCRLL